MRRALTRIVPEPILNRCTKAFVARSPVVALRDEWPDVICSLKRMVTEELGIVNRKAFLAAMERARGGFEVPMVSLACTLQLEFWLRGASDSNSLALHCPTHCDANAPRPAVTETQEVTI
jgi:hypothetical protein